MSSLTSQKKNSFLWSTIFLSILAIMGSAAPGIQFFGYNLFLFRLYTILHLGVLIYYIYKERVFRIGKLSIFVYMFFVLSWLSITWAHDRTIAIETISNISFLFILFISIQISISNRDELEKFMYALCLFIFVSQIISLIEIWFQLYLPISYTVQDGFSSLWYTNRNRLSFVYGMAAPLFLIYALRNKEFLSLLFSFGYLSSAYIVIMNGSRSAIGMILISTIAIICLLYFRELNINKLIAVDFFTPTLFSSAALLLSILAYFTNPFSEYSSLWIRYQLGSAVMEMLEQTYAMGVGVGNYNEAIISLNINTAGITSPHNWVAQLTGELGIIGLVLFLYPYAKVIYYSYVNYLSNSDMISLFLVGSLLSFGIGGLGPSRVFGMGIFWIIFATGFANIKLIVDTDTSQ